MEDYKFIFNELGIDHKFWNELKTCDPDIINEIIELAENINLFNWMLKSPEIRGYAKDKEQIKGKIIVDIEKIHVLEDMDFFRAPAIHYEKHGKYTNLYPNRHPNSDYIKYWKEEARRCLEGHVRESDGEWIPGYYYFYLNYSPIQAVIDILDENGEPTGRANKRTIFPEVWDSDYMFFHYVEQAERDGELGALLKTRRRGYSYKVAAMLARNYFLIKKSNSVAMASDSEYLEDEALLDDKTWNVLNFLDEHSAWSKSRLTNTKLKKMAGYIDPVDKLEKGYKSQIIGVTTGGNPEKGRGKSAKFIAFEEGGKFPHLLQTWIIAKPSVEQGDSVYGFMLAFGTGGTKGADFFGIQELFYNSKGYQVKTINNIFDKSKMGGTCALFIPEYMNRQNCYDKNGNSNVIKAITQLLKKRKVIRLNASDSNILTQEKAERPITPQEAILRFEGTMFPVGDLKSYLETINPTLDSFLSEHYVGDLVTDLQTGKVKFKVNADKKVNREFPLKDNKNKEGAIEIFKMPVKSPNGDITRFRYIAGIDTYDDDESSTNSLGSIHIMDMLTDEIVAEYTGRPNTANAFYETCLKLLKFYNAIGNYENDKKGLFAYFSHRHCLSYLCDVPEILKDINLIKGTNLNGNKSKGTNSNKKVNAWGRRLQADWMLMPVEGEEETGLLQLQRLRSPAYIKECIGWNEDGNYDRVSSMGMLMILREEYKKYIYFIKDEINNNLAPGLEEDPFFKINYKEKVEDNDFAKNIFKNKLNLNEL